MRYESRYIHTFKKKLFYIKIRVSLNTYIRHQLVNSSLPIQISSRDLEVNPAFVKLLEDLSKNYLVQGAVSVDVQNDFEEVRFYVLISFYLHITVYIIVIYPFSPPPSPPLPRERPELV